MGVKAEFFVHCRDNGEYVAWEVMSTAERVSLQFELIDRSLVFQNLLVDTLLPSEVSDERLRCGRSHQIQS